MLRFISLQAVVLIVGPQRNELLTETADQSEKEPCLREMSLNHGTHLGVRVGHLLKHKNQKSQSCINQGIMTMFQSIVFKRQFSTKLLQLEKQGY